MHDYRRHILSHTCSLKDALRQLDDLAADAIVFLVDEQNRLLGSLTDGDVRRGLLRGDGLDDLASGFIQTTPKVVQKSRYDLKDIIDFRERDLKIVPVLNDQGEIVNIINFRFQKSYLPLDALIMAGGRGSRLSPMTDTVPKPLLKVGEKPIIDYNVDRLRYFGIDDFHVSVRYLGEQLEAHYAQRAIPGVKMDFIWEREPLGTIGAASLVKEFHHEYVLVTNSDILTNLNYEDFFLDFLEKGADMSVLTIPYHVDIPYAVMETSNHHVVSFKEKPTYTYFSNGGIYIVKRELLNNVPKNTFYNATDLMEGLIAEGGKLISYPMRQYWLDIGKPEDYEKAQLDVKHLKL